MHRVRFHSKYLTIIILITSRPASEFIPDLLRIKSGEESSDLEDDEEDEVTAEMSSENLLKRARRMQSGSALMDENILENKFVESSAFKKYIGKFCIYIYLFNFNTFVSLTLQHVQQ